MNLGFFADIFFPPACVSCHRGVRAGVLCPGCHKKLISYSHSYNATHKTPLKKVAAAGGFYMHGAALRYEHPILKTLVHGLKFHYITGASEPLAEMLAAYARTALVDNVRTPGGCTVIPIPLSKRRLRLRGFNQSALIGRSFAEKLGLPFVEDWLLRPHHRKPQSETKCLDERLANIRGCFAANASKCKNKNVIVIDDVTTSGATFHEAARVLIEAGAARVIALAVAQA